MEFKLSLLAVKDINKSRKFYEDLFEQQVILDLGKNIMFSGGFGLQEDFPQLIGLSPDSVIAKSHNMELYFEVDDFAAFVSRLRQYSNIKYVHPPLKHDWQQRAVRIYDPDYHIIEIGESMTVIARRFLKEGYSIEETAKLIQHPPEFVAKCQP